MIPSRRASDILVAVVACTAFLLALSGCATASPSTTSGGGASEPVSAPPSTAPSESTSPTATPRPKCPVPERGGSCLGPLLAGTYTTVEFQPRITYAVPAGGWTNFEDLPGLFLLVPPGFDLAGVDAGGSDYIGIYANVVAANADCTESEQPGVEHTAAALAAEFAQRPGLVVTTKPVSVGGLQGLVLDIRLADGWTRTCFYSGGSPVVPLIRGVGLSSGLDTPIGPGFMMRLYLADFSGKTLAIELGDNSGGTHLDTYSAIVDQLHFGS